MSNKAVQVRVLPKGSIVMEYVLHTAVRGIVTSLPQPPSSSSKEKPGTVHLADLELESLNRVYPCVGKADYRKMVELWPRCMSDSLVSGLRIGDELSLDVHYYRPQKMFFGRNISLLRYRSLGREYGYVCRIMTPRETTNYGFLASLEKPVNSKHSDDLNYYFKLNEVKGLPKVPGPGGGAPVETELAVNMYVSFEVTVDNAMSQHPVATNGAAVPKYRAVRVHYETAEAVQKILYTPLLLATPANNTPAAVECVSVFSGTVIKEAKKDVGGTIKVALTADQEARYAAAGITSAVFPAPVYQHLLSFAQLELKELYMHSIRSLYADYIYRLVRYYGRGPLTGGTSSYGPGPLSGVAYDVLHPITGDKLPYQSSNRRKLLNDGLFVAIRLYKIADKTEYSNWFENVHKEEVVDKNVRDPDFVAQLQDNLYMQLKNGLISYQMSACDTAHGSIMRDMKVSLQCFLETGTNTIVARSIQLTAEDIPGYVDGVGVVQSITPGSNKSGMTSGYIRVIPSEEKLLFLHNNSGSNIINFQDGLEVSFQYKLIGGLRAAAGITKLAKGTLSKYSLVSTVATQSRASGPVRRCVAVVVTQPSDGGDLQYAVPIDISGLSGDFCSRYPDIWKHVHGTLKGMIITKDSPVPARGTPSPALTTPVPGSGAAVDEIKQFLQLFQQPVPVYNLELRENDQCTHADGARIVKDIGALRCIRNDLQLYGVGDIVECDVLVNPALQRSPIALCNCVLLASNTPGTGSGKSVPIQPGIFVTGRVSDTKLSSTVNDSAVHLCHVVVDELNLTAEVKALLTSGPNASMFDSNANNRKLLYSFFCDNREILGEGVQEGVGKGPNRNIAKGDHVKFMVLPHTHVVIGCTIVNKFAAPPANTSPSPVQEMQAAMEAATINKPKQSLFGKAIVTAPGGIAAGTAGADGTAPAPEALKGGVNNITMAMGPPESSAIKGKNAGPNSGGIESSLLGFPSGWHAKKLQITDAEEQESVRSLPWKHLLSHL